MSASDVGGGGEVITAMDNNNSYSLHNSPPGIPQPQSLLHNLSFAYPNDPQPTHIYNKPPPPASSPPPPPYQHTAGDSSASTGLLLSNDLNVVNSGGDTAIKRKRGRPRKYGPDGSVAPTAALVSSPPPPVAAAAAAPPPPPPPPPSGGSFTPSPHQPPPCAAAVPPSSTSASSKKPRGRPPGSAKKQPAEVLLLGSAGIGFTPHVLTVKAGEDVSAKIMSFSQHGPRAVCILSANGAISNVTLRQTATSGGTATYEGRFDILSLSGSFLLSEVGGQRSRTGGLSISLAGPDGRVLGGCVAGLLTAASPVQVIVGSFMADGWKESKAGNNVEPLYGGPLNVNNNPGSGGARGANSPPSSHGTLSESSGSPLNHSSTGTGACYNNNNNNNNVTPQGMSSMPWK